MKKLMYSVAALAVLFSACNSKQGTMSASTGGLDTTVTKNKETAVRNEKAFIKKDVDAVFKDLAPGYKEYGSGAMAMKPKTNIDSLKTEMKEFLVAFPDYDGTDLKAYADSDGSTILVTGMWTGTFKNEFMKMKPTQKKVNMMDADIFTFDKSGKITSHRSVQSEATFFAQLGIVMPPKKK